MHTLFLAVAIAAIALEALRLYLSLFGDGIPFLVSHAPGCWAVVGSTNFDYRSFSINDEVNLAILDTVTTI